MRRLWASVAAIGLLHLGACGSKTGTPSGGAGTNGGAGTGGQTGGAGTGGDAGASGEAGTTGVAGTVGSGGQTGAAGSGGQTGAGCPEGSVAPSAPLIADFTAADGGASIQIVGGLTTFGTPSPQLTFSGGSLHAVVTVVAGAEPQTVGFGVYFESCVNASAYSGVKFDMSGSVLGCTMSYAQNFAGDAFNGRLVDAGTTGDSKGACTLGPTTCVPPTATITATNQTVKFADLAGGAPVHMVDKTKLTGLLWQFAVDARPDGGPNSACSVDLTIDNVTFVP